MEIRDLIYTWERQNERFKNDVAIGLISLALGVGLLAVGLHGDLLGEYSILDPILCVLGLICIAFTIGWASIASSKRADFRNEVDLPDSLLLQIAESDTIPNSCKILIATKLAAGEPVNFGLLYELDKTLADIAYEEERRIGQGFNKLMALAKPHDQT